MEEDIIITDPEEESSAYESEENEVLAENNESSTMENTPNEDSQTAGKAETKVQPDNSAADVVNAPVVDLSAIETQLKELNARFEQKISTDAHKAALFDKMYEELQSYKTDLYAKILKPFVLATITLIDDTNTFLSKLEENDSRKAEKYLRNIPDDLKDILDLNGVEQYESDGDVFNPRTQKAIKTISTDDPALEKHIARRLRPGYRWNGSILKTEVVYIYKFEANN
jgi:molecular chaperone GrpE (heat shock protein)